MRTAMPAGLIFANPKIVTHLETHMRIDNIPLAPPPKPEPPKPQPRTPAPQPRVTAPPPPIPLPQPTSTIVALEPPPLPPIATGFGHDTGPAPLPTSLPEPPLPLPALVGPEVDPRYADALQPTYPPEERRAGREGKVVLRVLVGTDGRVKQVERVSAASDAFFGVTERQALAHWRFRPAHRGAEPVEAWRTMTLTFVIAEGD